MKSELLHLVLTREKRVTRIELCQDTTEAPHVNSSSVWDSEDDLGGSIKPRLYVSVDSFVLEARRSKVDDLDSRLIWCLEKDVLGLEVTMNDLVIFDVFQTLQDLNGKSADQTQTYSLEVVVFDELIQVDAEEFKRDAKMLSENHIILHADDVMRIFRVVLFQML